VGIVQVSNDVALCSGVLLAPNLVATARHCVAQTDTQVTCATSVFGSVLPPSEMLVTTASVITQRSAFTRVLQIVTPSAANQTKVCGDDIALMILDHNIALPQYVTPTIDPPMTDHTVYSTNVAAIGYGISTPTDEAGVTSGTRRIKENIALYCIPNDTSFANCFSDPMASQILAADEFVSGNASTCEGDSGSGAFDQASFNRGQWVAFGVLSRGAVSSDGQTCIQPIYSRFDAWGPLLIGTAQQAASMGGYSAPVWAGGTGPDLNPPGADAAASGPLPGTVADGQSCGQDSDCGSQNCVSTDDVTFVCASPCSGTTCISGFTCTLGYCFQGSAPSSALTHAKGGCSVASVALSGRWGGAESAMAGFALIAAGEVRRRSRARASRSGAQSLRSRRRA
jgi:hypothetical protein